MKLVIKGRFEGLNEYINACRRNPHEGAKMKNRDEQTVLWFAKLQLRKIKSPCRMQYTWYERNRKRDMDNVSSYGRKVIQDALVHGGYLSGDGWNHIIGFSDEFRVDKKEPRIEVEIEEVQNEP